MIAMALLGWQWEGLDFLFIENAGNPACPATFHLGEAAGVGSFLGYRRGGQTSPVPTIFNTSDVAVITKLTSLPQSSSIGSPPIEAFSRCGRACQSGRTPAKTGEGMDAWLGFLELRLTDLREDRQAAANFQPNHEG